MRDIQDLIDGIDEVVKSNDDRRRARDAALPAAQRMARTLAWTHRAGRAGKGDWRDIFHERRLRATPVGTAFERVLGLRRAVYFFVGSCAYPEGLAVFLFAFAPDALDGSTFNPYDTGGLKECVAPPDSRVEWSGCAKVFHVASTMGWAHDLPNFMGHYLAAHFRDPIDYVRRPQASTPDFEPHHGLTGGDRRGWTIEARTPGDVSIEPGGRALQEVWLEDQSLRKELPRDFRKHARVSKDGMTLAESVAQRIEQILGEARS